MEVLLCSEALCTGAARPAVQSTRRVVGGRKRHCSRHVASSRLALPPSSGSSPRSVATNALATPKPFWDFFTGAAVQSSPQSPASLPLVLPEDLVVAPGVVVPVARRPGTPAVDLVGYLRRILTAKVYDVAVRAVHTMYRIHSMQMYVLSGLLKIFYCIVRQHFTTFY